MKCKLTPVSSTMVYKFDSSVLDESREFEVELPDGTVLPVLYQHDMAQQVTMNGVTYMVTTRFGGVLTITTSPKPVEVPSNVQSKAGRSLSKGDILRPGAQLGILRHKRGDGRGSMELVDLYTAQSIVTLGEPLVISPEWTIWDATDHDNERPAHAITYNNSIYTLHTENEIPDPACAMVEGLNQILRTSPHLLFSFRTPVLCNDSLSNLMNGLPTSAQGFPVASGFTVLQHLLDKMGSSRVLVWAVENETDRLLEFASIDRSELNA